MRKKRESSQQQRNAVTTGRPELFRYHDYRVFLKDWLSFLRASQSGFSLRDLASSCGISPSYLSMVLSGARNLTPKALAALSPRVGFTDAEKKYFRCLITLADSGVQTERQDAFRRMSKMLSYRRTNPDEDKTYEYFSHWYYVAIREMAGLVGFKPDPQWIHERLHPKVGVREIKQALEFLISQKFITVSTDGMTASTTEQLNCKGEVFKLALSRFHQEMFSLAAGSIEATSSSERNILGYTLAVDEEKFKRIHALLGKIQNEISEIAKEPGKSDRVMQVELAFFPLTERK